MQAYQDHYIHDLTPEKIVAVLQFDVWKVKNQSITSAITNDNDLASPSELYVELGENTSGPNAFADIEFDTQVKRILDVGGGKFNVNRDYLKLTRNIDLLIWDPFGRSSEHNLQVQFEVMGKKVDAATSMSILNVIPEPELRLAHINTVKVALTPGGKAYFKIWPGEQPLKGSYLPSGTSAYYQANAYADRFFEEIEMVFGVGYVKIDKIPNLIIAEKKTESNASSQAIIQVQNKSKYQMRFFESKKRKVDGEIYSSGIKLYSANITLFRKNKNYFLERNRHNDSKLQHEYDKRYGLIAI